MNRIFIGLIVFSLTAQVPQIIQYRGKLTTTTGVGYNNNHNIFFRIYNVETVGTALWVGFHPVVPVQNGLFDVTLGETIPIELIDSVDWNVEIPVNMRWTFIEITFVGDGSNVIFGINNQSIALDNGHRLISKRLVYKIKW